MNTSISSQSDAQQPARSPRPARGVRRVALAFALGASLVGGVALAHAPATLQHAAAAIHAAQASSCPSVTLICP